MIQVRLNVFLRLCVRHEVVVTYTCLTGKSPASQKLKTTPRRSVECPSLMVPL